MFFFTRDRLQRSAIEAEAAELRQFLVEYFSREELEVFCADYFRDIYVDFEGSAMSKTQWTHKLVDYCRRRNLMSRLRAALQKERREPFVQRFALIPEAGVTRFSRDQRRIFISHAHEDRQVAQRLAGDLRKHGHAVWIAPDSIEPGESWVSAIDRGLHVSGVFLALLSPAAVKSPWVKSETRVAIQLEHQKKMRVLPVMLKPCDTADLSTFITSYQTVSLGNRYDKALPELLVELGSSRARVAAQAIARRLQGGNGKARWSKQVEIEVPIRMEMLRVPAGSFWMGSHPDRDEHAQENEQPRHRVKLADYYIARHPVTHTQYAMFAQAMQRDFKLVEGKEDHPVVNVSWHDAAAFCTWLSQLTGFQFNLPTEAEWEKAARGTDGRIYPWGDEFEAKRLNSFENGIRETTPAGKYSPEHDSPYGIADMCGNVWEWCADWYAEDEYARRAKARTVDPLGPEAGMMKVLRGGAFDFNKSAVRCAYRAANSPFERSYDYGFRVVMRP
jgi:formylglycine-generating enzyme required for sulfatase activity